MFFKKDSLFHPGFFTFHLVSQSPWPLTVSFSLFFFVIGILKFIYFKNFTLINVMSFCFVVLSFMGWQGDILSETVYNGDHTLAVQKGLKIGMVLFILSELLFFFSFFWSLFFIVMPYSPILDSWPPIGVKGVDPLKVPLLGTLILVSSGISVTWSHHSILKSNWTGFFISLLLTVVLGFFFTFLQVSEYMNNTFSMSDSVYGSIFYMMTGFHGIHVIIGSIFLMVCLIRSLFIMSYSNTRHIGLEFSIWYWHFVDVIWLFLFIFLYF